MAEVLTIPPAGTPPRESLTERHGGLLFSLFFHLMLLALLVSRSSPTKPMTEGSERIHISLAPPPPAAMPMPRPREITVDEAVRTSTLGSQVDHIARDNTALEEIAWQNATPNASQAEQSTERDHDSFSDDPERERSDQISEQTRRLMETFNDLAAADSQQLILAHQQLQGRLFEEQEEFQSSNADYISSGATDGHIRELDVHDVPLAIVRQVLGRYGAEVGTSPQFVETDADAPPTTLNAARVGDQVLTAQRTPSGPAAMWIRYGDMLSARLLDLERLEMAHRGLNPSRVILTKTVFSVERSPTSGWGLTVRDMQFVEVN
jgi:hypothetical protein